MSDQPTEMFDHRYNLVAQANGGTIDTNSHSINFTAPISHDPTLGSAPDGGMTIVDSAGGGNLTYSVANTYTGPTKIGAGGKLTLNVANAHSHNVDRQPGRRDAVHQRPGSKHVGGDHAQSQRQLHARFGRCRRVQLCRQHAFALAPPARSCRSIMPPAGTFW